MPNHALAALPVESKLSSSPIIAETPGSEIETKIGAAIAEAVLLLFRAVEKYEAGRSTIALTGQGAEQIAKLYGLWQSAPEIDFTAVAHRAGRRAMRAILMQNPAAADLCQYHDLDQVLDELVAMPLNILTRVTADMRAEAN